jgi:endonuclease/exonuclease/phosphatase family metal-dependent hydrolase
MARNTRDISFASFNLYNLQLPGLPMNPRQKPWTDAEYKQKLAWGADALHRLDADVIAFQELWSRQALEEMFAAAALADEYELAFIKDGAWDGIAVAAAVRKPWKIVARTRHKPFPPQLRLIKRKRTMAEIQADPPAADRAAEDAEGGETETLPSHEDDAIEVKIAEFSRSPLQVSIEHATARRPKPPRIEVFCCHLKSKLTTRLDNEEYRDKAVRAHAEAIGGALSAIRRVAEASALRVILDRLMTDTDHPVVVVGDLNDGQFSNALAVASGAASFRPFLASSAGKRSDRGLYNALALQQLRSIGDVYYTHEFRDVREAIDHVLVSEQFYDFSEKRQWSFRELVVINDHLDGEARAATDHGLPRAAFDWLPAA